MTPPIPITIVRFTYRLEEDLLPIVLRTDHKAWPHAIIHLVDDSANPVSDKCRATLSAMEGVFYHQSTFDRGVNLNGKEAIAGVLEWLLRCAAMDNNKDGMVFKIDPDTMIVSPRYINDALDGGARWIACTAPNKCFAGMFYGAPYRMLKEAHGNVLGMELPYLAEEDLVVGSLLYMAAHKEKYWYADVNLKGNIPMFCAADWSVFHTPGWKEYCRQAAQVAGILTVGNNWNNNIPGFYRPVMAWDIWQAMQEVEAAGEEQGDLEQESSIQEHSAVEAPVEAVVPVEVNRAGKPGG